MQLKGLVKFFTVALILISLYQLSFTYVVRNVEKKARAKAEKQVKLANPSATGQELEKLVDARFQEITDSMQGTTVMSVPLVKKFTLLEAKEQELNLGLDLQGGMNVTLEVSLDELVRSMSNNPKDPALNKAIADANKAKANSQANFVTLFGEEYAKANPSGKLAFLFSKPSEKEITITSTNEEVLKKINKEAKDAIKRTYNVLLTRIDKFGVASPNINLDDNKGIITVELAGVRDPERVRAYLQSTAKLQFFETYSNEEIINSIQPANDALAAYLSGSKEDTTAADTTADVASNNAANSASDTASLSSLLAGGKTDSSKAGTIGDSTALAQKDAVKKNPLFAVWYPNITQQGNINQGPVVGIVAKKDTAKLNRYLALDAVRNKFPNNVKFVYGAQDKKESKNPNAPLMLYALKTAVGESESKLEGDHVTDARMDYNQLTGKPEVTMSMDITGSRIWKKMTGDNKGKFVAVVLDDKVYSAPLVNGEIPNGNTSISGNFTVEDATDLANILKSGKLPAPARIVQEQVVGPTLGAESIDAGMNSLIISFLVIFVLMLVYYNTGGIVANISLILNIFFTIGFLSALGATLTMPGIAGLVLGIGMAVDTNVIIFERIKEELAGGSTYDDAIRKGYNNSLAPVLDGHVTILITSIILFAFGLGPVLGFATTQIISILLSLYCGILVSRLVTDIYTKRERHFKYFTGLSKAIFRKAHFNFVGARKIAYGISVLVLLAGIGSFLNGFDYGVEFDGGRSYTVKFDKKYTVGEIREKLKGSFNGEYPVVKTIGQDNQLNITTAYLIKEPGQAVEAQVQNKLYEGLKSGGFIPATVDEATFVSKYIQSSQTVLPTISDDLKAGAVKATIFSLIAIFIYILIRFRKWQYSLGTIVALLHDVCVTLAVFSFFRGVVPFALEIDQHFIAAVLTVIGFSMNDTVIVFDRIREYFRKNPKEGKHSVINRAINDTLSRTIMTSLTVFLSVLILFIFGGEVTRGFAFAMLIGVITGTYSSIFVAAPILVDMDKSEKLSQEIDREAQIEELKKLA
ncbi:protein translocase subunit SecDF [Chitinophagaceae bacterium IBVUCB1]|nr:protein translocase subunit SecDF [Chitinophagaceae bacterium IBVUCB1]